MNLKDHIRGVPDFPRPGILFYDISTLIRHADAWRATVKGLAEAIRPWQPQILAGIESRGFLAAAPVALELGIGLTMIRKRGKLPGPVVSHSYALEYGEDTVQIQTDAVHEGQRVVVLDDLLATGGTLAAGIELLRKVGADVVGAATIIELAFLSGRGRIDVPLHALLQYDS